MQSMRSQECRPVFSVRLKRMHRRRIGKKRPRRQKPAPERGSELRTAGQVPWRDHWRHVDPLQRDTKHRSNLIGECVSEVFLRCDPIDNPSETSPAQPASGLRVPSDASETDSTEAGTQQTIEITANIGEAHRTASVPGCGTRCSRRRRASQYTCTLQSPVRARFQWPLVIAPRDWAAEASAARSDQFGARLTAYQQYACNKFGPACRIALAVQRAENPRGACEIYHYNSDGTLDWATSRSIRCT